MKAVVMHGYGGTEVLKLEQVRAVARIRNALKKVEKVSSESLREQWLK